MTANDPTAEERAEILSHLYVHAARIVGPLDSGRFAVCAMARGQIIGMMTAADVPELIKLAAQESIRQYDLKKKEERAQRAPLDDDPGSEQKIVNTANPDELGL